MSGKGDTRRPSSVPRDTVALNWDRIFRTEPVLPRPSVSTHYCKSDT